MSMLTLFTSKSPFLILLFFSPLLSTAAFVVPVRRSYYYAPPLTTTVGGPCVDHGWRPHLPRPSHLCQTSSAATSLPPNDLQKEKDNVHHGDSILFESHPRDDTSGNALSSVDVLVQSLLDAPSGTLKAEDVKSLRQVMHRLAQETDDATLVEQLLYRLLSEYQATRKGATPTTSIEPNSQDFLAALLAWKRSMGQQVNKSKGSMVPKAVQRVMKLYDDQQQLYRNSGLESLAPNDAVVETVLSVLSTCRERTILKKVGDVFHEYPRKYRGQPTVHMYRSLIESIARSRERGCANKAESILKEAAEKFPRRLDENGQPVGVTLDMFNVILTAWAKSGLEYGPERAEKLLVYMEQLEAKQGNPGLLRPSVSSLTSLIDAYAQTNEWEGVGQGERILNRMLDFHLQGESNDMEPNVATWTIVISAWARLSRKNNRGAASRAGRLLRRMEALHQEGRISFGPDAVAYVTCLNAYAFSKTVEGPTKAREILDEMYERYLDGDDTMKPSAKSIRIVIDAFVNSNTPNCMDEAERTLDHYEDLLESLATPEDPYGSLEHLRDVYRTLLFGWCKQSDPEQAQAYLLDMVERDMKPDCFCWDRAIEVNTRAGDANALNRNMELWDLMLECERKGDVKPNERVYTSFMRSLTKAKAENLSQRCYGLLKEMQQGYEQGNKGLAPTVFTYNAVLMACSEDPTPTKMDAFTIAIRVFNELRQTREGPDHVSFGNLLRCANLLPDGEQKEALVRSTFQLCCQRGSVNAFVIRDLQAASSEPFWRSLLQCPQGDVNLERFPAAWSARISTR